MQCVISLVKDVDIEEKGSFIYSSMASSSVTDIEVKITITL